MVSIDRIEPCKGYVNNNIRLVCWWANIARSTMSDEDLFIWCKRAAKQLEKAYEKCCSSM